jgi:hypothetical protein
MNTLRLCKALAIGWLFLPVTVCAGAFSVSRSETELSLPFQALSAVVFMPMICGTFLFAFMVARRLRTDSSKNQILPSLPLLLAVVTSVSGIWLNTVPRRISPETVQTSPFDRYFEYAPQTAWGSPCPFYRIYDQAHLDIINPGIKEALFDFTSLLGDVTLWTLPVYALTTIALVLSPKPSEQDT